MSSLSFRRVVCSAIRNNTTGAVILGVRHYDKFMHESIKSLPLTKRKEWYTDANIEQGFVDNYYTFLTREEALAVALVADQRLSRCGGDDHILYSENLY